MQTLTAESAGSIEATACNVRLFLQIDGVTYLAFCLRPHPSIARTAWRLQKVEGMSYDVHAGANGPECTCPDFVFRRSNRDARGCKHVAGLRAAGLMD